MAGQKHHNKYDKRYVPVEQIETQVLNRLNLSVKTGEKIALVGESGCGKSTVIQLIQRLYDLDNGCLDLQGNNIQALNLPYVRC